MAMKDHMQNVIVGNAPKKGVQTDEVMGIDLGFVQSKASSGVWETKFGSIVKPRSEVALTGLADSDGFAITYEDKAYSVGAKGSYDFNADRLTRDTDTAKLLAVFGQYQEETNVHAIDLLVTGLPIFEFSSYKEQLRASMMKQFLYHFGNKKNLLTVHDVAVIPQSAGAYYDYILDGEGEPIDTPLAMENNLVLDIGGRTTDGCIMEASRYSQESFTIFQGVWKAQQALRRLIMQEFHYNTKPYEVDVVMRTGMLRLAKEDHNAQELVYRAVASVYPELRDELTLFVDDFRRFASVMLVGGGAHVFHDFLAEDINAPIIISNEAHASEYANARGYRKFGKLRLNEASAQR